jgi:ABC-type nitrate/sulfonate/bicarbonate transport system substrate-binding protein
MTNLSLYIADRRGFFKEQQIFNEIIVMRSAARQMQALIAASIELSAQAPDPLIRAVERGADLTMLSGLANSAAYDLVADKNFAQSKSCAARPWEYPELIHQAHSSCRKCSLHMA